MGKFRLIIGGGIGIIWLWGAAGIYLDGKLLAQYGKVGLSMSDEEGQLANPDLDLPRSIVFDGRTDHVLAVRYSNFFLMEEAPNIWHGFQQAFLFKNLEAQTKELAIQVGEKTKAAKARQRFWG